MDVFSGLPVRDYAAALLWYERLLGMPPSFFPNEVEAVWQVGEHSYVYVERRPERAGNAMVTLFVEDLHDRVTGIARRGIEPVADETYENGVRKVTYRDADGNEIGLGGGPD